MSSPLENGRSLNPDLDKESSNNHRIHLDNFRCMDNQQNSLHVLYCNLQRNLYLIHMQ